MSETQGNPENPVQAAAESSEELTQVQKGNLSAAKTNYILYLVALVIGITAIIAVIFAYVKRGSDNPEWVNSHFSFQIQTFWYGLVYAIVGLATSVIIIGWFILLFWMIWLIVRCVKGMSALDAQKPIQGGFFSFGDS